MHRIPLSREAAGLLAGLPTRAAEAGPFTVLPVWQLHRRWVVIRSEAGLEGVRIHDLRHSFASILASSGLSLPIIGAAARAQPGVDHAALRAPADEALRRATAKVGRAVRGKSNVVPMRRGTKS